MNTNYIENNSVRLNYLENETKQDMQKTSILFIPGMLGHAEHYQAEIEKLNDRYCLALSLRGRGKSDSPKTGYSYEDHLSDIESCCNQILKSPFIIVAHSVGVPYALGYALKNPNNLKGLILIDYPAVYIPLSEKWVENLLEQPGINKQLILGLKNESRFILLWDKLDKIQYPVLVIRGGKEGALLPKDDSKLYEEKLEHIKVATLANSGHEPSKEDFNEFLNLIKNFAAKTEASS